MDIQPSATLAISTLIKEKKARGEEVFDLGVGEIIGIPSPEVLDFVKNKLTEPSAWQYPAILGSKELREAAADWSNQEYQTSYSAQNVLVTAGGKFAIFILLQSLLRAGEEVLIPVPYWVSYPEIVKLFGGAPKFILTTRENEWKIIVEDLEKLWTPQTKILILNNISNPAGVIYDESELKKILDWATSKNIIVISDEVYSSLVFDSQQKFFSGGAIETKGQIIIVQSCSKNFAMSGWRVGFIFGNTGVIKMASVIQSQSITALAAIKSRINIQKNIRSQVVKRRDELVKSLADYCDLKITAPSAGLYLFISLKELGIKHNDSVSFAQEFLDQSNVAVVPGKAFGVEGYIRLSFGGPETEIREGIKRLALFIKNLNQ
ncbi:MAG: aminotransferase class I/II-fold pyridoxal phosphate-dependent enzyme [Candidatus Falkowbacteria bacterium]|nr:aminotransferase class I/II-fold pyridoxal phosphate-dependent enzyme [Candidatus Falkowbacteria bacterium]